MAGDDTPFKATAASALIVARALSEALDVQHPSVSVTARALLAELVEQSKALDSEHCMLAAADVDCAGLLKYPCVERIIGKTGYSDNIFIQILRELGTLKLAISSENLGRGSLVSHRSLTLDAFDIIELYPMQSADDRYVAPQWAVRLGQWGNWLMSAEARSQLGRIARAALSLDEHAAFKMAIKLGEYTHFVLLADPRPNEMRVPLLNILAEVSSVSVLEMRDRQHEEQLAVILKTFEAAAQALRAEGLCTIRLLRSAPAAANAPFAHNDNFDFLYNSLVSISAAG